MPTALDRGFIFVHIPKTGGTSVTAALHNAGVVFDFDGDGIWGRLEALPNGADVLRRLKRTFPINTIVHFAEKHLPAQILREFVTREVWQRAFSFAIVRNPWDLVVSTYFFIAEHRGDFDRLEPDYADIIGRSDFARFVRLYPMIASDQTSMIEDDAGRIIVDFVGRFERLAEDFASACARIDLRSELPQLNTTAHQTYRNYYDDDTRALIEHHFRRDIARFGYAF